MRFLIETNVISYLKRPRPHPSLISWMSERRADELFVPAISIFEIQRGIEQTRRNDPKISDIREAWLASLAESFQIAPLDGRAAALWGRMVFAMPNESREDLAIAAIAMRFDFTLVTCDSDFQRVAARFPIRCFNPIREVALNPICS